MGKQLLGQRSRREDSESYQSPITTKVCVVCRGFFFYLPKVTGVVFCPRTIDKH